MIVSWREWSRCLEEAAASAAAAAGGWLKDPDGMLWRRGQTAARDRWAATRAGASFAAAGRAAKARRSKQSSS